MSILDEVNPRYQKVDPEPHPPESLRKLKEEDSFEDVKRWFFIYFFNTFFTKMESASLIDGISV